MVERQGKFVLALNLVEMNGRSSAIFPRKPFRDKWCMDGDARLLEFLYAVFKGAEVVATVDNVSSLSDFLKS